MSLKKIMILICVGFVLFSCSDYMNILKPEDFVIENNVTNYSTTLLVDFNNPDASKVFGIYGWHNILKSDNVTNFNQETNGLTTNNSYSEFDSYYGISGPARSFIKGEKIVVTWYNNSESSILFTPLVSFIDKNNPDPNLGEPQWYPMSELRLNAKSSGTSEYKIINDFVSLSPITEPPLDLLLTEGEHEVVNIYPNIIKNNQLIIDKIEIVECDIIPPTTPDGLSPIEIKGSSISLKWNASQDEAGIDKYRIYKLKKDKWEVFANSTTTEVELVLLEPSTEYKFCVKAIDKNGNESEASDILMAKTGGVPVADELINPVEDMEYMGAFTPPYNYPDGKNLWNNFLYGLTFSPVGDSSGSSDGYLGSLFGYGNGMLVSEISIPAPVIAESIDSLPAASILQNFTEVMIESYPTGGTQCGDMLYLPKQGNQNSDKLYLINSDGHVQDEKYPTHLATELDLSSGVKYGTWIVGDPVGLPVYYDYSRFIFEIPPVYAYEIFKMWPGGTPSNSAQMSLIGTGGRRSGLRGGVGPAVMAIAPWLNAGSNECVPGHELGVSEEGLPYVKLLNYDNPEKAVLGYDNNDRANGAAIITNGSGKGALVFAIRNGVVNIGMGQIGEMLIL